MPAYRLSLQHEPYDNFIDFRFLGTYRDRMVSRRDRPIIPRVRERLDMKCPATVRHVLELAARAYGESLTHFVLRAALARARATVFDGQLLEAADKDLREMGLRY